MKLIRYWPWFVLFGVALVLSLAAVTPFRRHAEIERVYQNGGRLETAEWVPPTGLLEQAYDQVKPVFERHGPPFNFDEVSWAKLWTARFGDADVLRVSRFSKLKGIELQNSSVTDAGLAHLCGLNEIEELNLRETDITDEGLKFLEDLKSLEGVYLQNTHVTSKGVAKLRNALPHCEIYH